MLKGIGVVKLEECLDLYIQESTPVYRTKLQVWMVAVERKKKRTGN